MILAKYSADYDGVEICGLEVFTEKEWSDFRSEVIANQDSFYFWVRDIPTVLYANGKALLKDIEISHITQEEANVLHKFNVDVHGLFPRITDLADNIEDDILDFHDELATL